MIEKKHNHLILLDFDHTLFNTTKFVNRLQEVFHSLGVDHADFHQHRQTLNEMYTTDEINQFINKLSFVDKKSLHEIVHTTIENEARHYVFDDVDEFLLRHKDHFDLIILTHGDYELQSEKILHSNFVIKLPSVIVPKDKYTAIAEFTDSYEKIYFVDDMTENIDSAKKAYPDIATYFMQREIDTSFVNTDSTSECADYIITNLKGDIQ